MISSVRIQLLLLLFVTAALEEETLWASLSLVFWGTLVTLGAVFLLERT